MDIPTGNMGRHVLNAMYIYKLNSIDLVTHL